MTYALINEDGTINKIELSQSFFWRGLHLTSVNSFTSAERKKLGIYSYYQKYMEVPEGKRQCGFIPEIDHIAGEVYETPIFVDLSEEELTAQKDADIKAEISAIEASVSPRRLREAMLTAEGKLWIAEQDAKIEELRKQLSSKSKE